MKRIASAAVLLLLLLPAAALAGWDLDSSLSAVRFKARFMGMTVPGTFSRFSGKVVYDERDITRSSADVTIDAASIDTGIGLRNRDLRSARYFNVAEFPTITFKSRKVEQAGEGKLKVTGALTLHGVTREVVLDVGGPSPPAKDAEGRTRVTGTAATRINWNDYGMSSALIGDEFDILIDINLVKTDEPG
jgi:polyisoprenoid-binding protein YceI